MFDDHVGIVGAVVVKKTRHEEIIVRFSKFQLKVTHVTDCGNIFARHVTMMSDLSSVNRKFTITRNAYRCRIVSSVLRTSMVSSVCLPKESNEFYVPRSACMQRTRPLRYHQCNSAICNRDLRNDWSTGRHNAKTAGYVRVGIVVVSLQKRFEVGIYRKRDFELILIIFEFHDIFSRFRINDLLWW